VKVEFKKSFAKDLKRHNDNKKLMRQLMQVILSIENATHLDQIRNLKKLKASGPYWRIRVGFFRIGLKLTNNTIIFVRFLHRREIYRYFP